MMSNLLWRFIIISCVLHGFLFLSNRLLGFVYSKPQFAVEEAPSSVDIVFIEEVPDEPVEETQEVMTIKEVIKEMPVVEVKKISEERKPELPKEIPPPVKSVPQQGALIEAKPDYLKNPAPKYPWKARQNGWEGVVVLNVSVSSNGDPIEVSIKTSSGYVVLDEAAVQAVNKWRFRPAKLGNVSVDSTVQVPVRFELK